MTALQVVGLTAADVRRMTGQKEPKATKTAEEVNRLLLGDIKLGPTQKQHPRKLVEAIRRDHTKGLRNIDICRKHGVTASYVSRITSGHIKREDAL